ncbi:MAG: 33 kDa chaperonin [Micavibrio sp.]|nr:MAG: 33 kDa chaperonin [Micavibrio sp.]
MEQEDSDRPDDNVIQTFQLETSQLRGRIVRLGATLNDIVEPHQYPQPVAHLVAETVTLAALLSSMIKYDGIFTLQAQGDGPVKMIVADVTSEGQIRGCAHFDEERLEHSWKQLEALKRTEKSQNNFAQLLGKGYIAFTVDQGDETDCHQGIVDLKGHSMVECVQHYFTQSEQIGTGIKMAVGKRDDVWRSGGVMLQHMPEDEQNPESGAGNINEDDWRRSMILLDSCTEDEFLSPDLHSNIVLMRLFHEEGIRVYAPHTVEKACRCSEEKVENVLAMMPKEDRDYMAVEGEIIMHCEFCSQDYIFDAKAFEKKLKQRQKETEKETV